MKKNPIPKKTMNLLFLDTETTDLEQRRLVQLAYKRYGSDEVFNGLFKPPISITAGASEQNHIVDEDVANAPIFAGSEHAQVLQEILKDHILIAHNAAFDMEVLKNEGVETRMHICTQKVAQSIFDDPAMEKFSQQYLRYYLKLYKTEPEKRYIAHDAYGDIMVLEKLFLYIFTKMQQDNKTGARETIAQMVNISMNPILLKRLTYGKHKGKTYEELARTDPSYLAWIRDKKEGTSPDELFTIKTVLAKMYAAADNARVV